MKISTVAFLGGDERMKYAEKFVRNEGYLTATCCTAEEALSYDAVVLPVPAVMDNNDVEKIRGKLIFGGKLPPELKGSAVDYALREDFALYNAVPTAEGALQLIMEKLPVTVNGCRILVLGYGRVGKACCERFSALGGKVTAAVRRSEILKKIKADGINAVKLSSVKPVIGEYDVIVNTIPQLVLDRDALMNVRNDSLLIELASAPYGFDVNVAEDLGLNYVIAGGLPGKVAPKTAGEIIGKVILNIFSEIGVEK